MLFVFIFIFMFCDFSADVRHFCGAAHGILAVFRKNSAQCKSSRRDKAIHNALPQLQLCFFKFALCRYILRQRANFYSFIQSLKSAVDKYLSPLSGRRATIVFPLFSGRFASSTAAKSAAPALIPTSTPSLFPMSLP